LATVLSSFFIWRSCIRQRSELPPGHTQILTNTAATHTDTDTHGELLFHLGSLCAAFWHANKPGKATQNRDQKPSQVKPNTLENTARTICWDPLSHSLSHRRLWNNKKNVEGRVPALEIQMPSRVIRRGCRWCAHDIFKWVMCQQAVLTFLLIKPRGGGKRLGIGDSGLGRW